MADLPAAVRPCVDEAIARSVALAGRAVDHACNALTEELRRRPAGTDVRDLSAALRELAELRAEWCAGFPAVLRRVIGSGGRSARPSGPMLSPSSLTLTLVDDSEVMESIESSRLAQQLEAMLEQPLAELDAYMSSALQLEGIQPEYNPLRPALVAQALRSLMNDSQPLPGRPALWMRSMAEPVAADLHEIYKSCVKLLARSGVRAAGYRVVTGPAPLESRPRTLAQELRPSRPTPLRGAPDGHRRNTMSAWIELAGQALGGTALRDFLFRPAGHSPQPLAPAFYDEVGQELAQLEARHDESPPDPRVARQYQHLPVVDRPVLRVGVESPLSPEAWGDYAAPRQRSLVRSRLRQQAREVEQVMGLDVVRQLVAQVAQDPRLLAPVRESIVALEPSLARLALHEPRFFGQHDNPARKLLEAVAQRSFKFNDEFSSEFQSFFEAVKTQFNALNRIEAVPDPAPFHRALASLADEWGALDRAEAQQQESMVAAVQNAERRQAQADQIAWELSQRSDLDGVPSVVQDFLFGPWTLVIVQARLTGSAGDLDPGGYLGAISHLLWSIKRDEVLRDPARAFAVIPQVLIKLRAGLDLLGQPPSDSETFFNALERLHRPVLELRAKHRQQALPPGLADAPVDDDLQPAPAQKPAPRASLWLRAAELKTVGFADTVPFEDSGPALEGAAQAPLLAVAGSATASPAVLTPEQADATIVALAEGCWVDLFSKQRWLRARLTWASTHGTLYMFASHGGQPHSMTRRSLQRLVATRLLRPLQTGEVVQQALDTLARPTAPDALAA
jgi:hypothetical protein